MNEVQRKSAPQPEQPLPPSVEKSKETPAEEKAPNELTDQQLEGVAGGARITKAQLIK